MQHIQYKRVKHTKYENLYNYIVKLSRIKYTEKMEHNIKCLLLFAKPSKHNMAGHKFVM